MLLSPDSSGAPDCATPLQEQAPGMATRMDRPFTLISGGRRERGSPGPVPPRCPGRQRCHELVKYSKLPSEHCAEEPVRSRSTASSENKVLLAPHTMAGVRPADSTVRVRVNSTTKQLSLQQKSLFVDVPAFPPNLAQSPGLSLLLKCSPSCYVACFPSSLLGFWDFSDPSSFGASSKLFNHSEKFKQQIGQLQTDRQEKLHHCNMPIECMDQHSHPATGLGCNPFKIKVHTPDAAAPASPAAATPWG
jgi:hypothetical protein